MGENDKLRRAVLVATLAWISATSILAMIALERMWTAVLG